MKKLVVLSLASLALAVNVQATQIIYSDADYFGGGAGTPPSGIQLKSSGGTASVTGSFNFAAADGTASFTVGAPYASGDQGTYTSVTGFVSPLSVVPGSMNFTLFFRDPNAGAEVYAFAANDLYIAGGPISTKFVLHLNGGDTASVDAEIDATGKLNYTISASSGEFILDAAYAEITATTDGGSTVALLGLALVGVEGLRRKLKGSNAKA